MIVIVTYHKIKAYKIMNRANGRKQFGMPAVEAQGEVNANTQ